MRKHHVMIISKWVGKGLVSNSVLQALLNGCLSEYVYTQWPSRFNKKTVAEGQVCWIMSLFGLTKGSPKQDCHRGVHCCAYANGVKKTLQWYPNCIRCLMSSQAWNYICGLKNLKVYGKLLRGHQGLHVVPGRVNTKPIFVWGKNMVLKETPFYIIRFAETPCNDNLYMSWEGFSLR